MDLAGEHWTVRNVHLHAFTDDGDTLTDEDVRHMFARNVFYPVDRNVSAPLTGNLFFLENPEDGTAITIVSETPDYQTASLKVLKGAVKIENGGNGLAVGFCKIGECEKLARDYYRHAKKPRPLITMSNTWGDCNSQDRVCSAFIKREVDAAAEIGIDIVQIDDGWQEGYRMPGTANGQGRRTFLDPFWELVDERFPEGMKHVTDYAAAKGVQIGLWFAPDTDNDYERFDRDVAVLKKAYDEWGARFFKLDMYWVTSDAQRDRFLDLLRAIYSFGDDVAVQLDITRNGRMNYLCGRQFGTVFVENRYTKTANSFPHRILRNLWMVSHYVPASKFQFELINPELNRESYRPGDPFQPSLFDMDYMFAAVMLSNPLIWMEMQFLPENRRAELKRIIPVWKEHRGVLARADVMPVGEKPSGRSFPGFFISENGEQKYLLLFREVTDKADTVIFAPVKAAEAKILAAKAGVSVDITDGVIRAHFDKERAYAFIQL